MSAQPIFGVCFGCGVVAWELLNGVSDYCLDCDPASYRNEDDDDWCASCDCERFCERDAVAAVGGES